MGTYAPDRLRRARTNAGLSRHDLASRIGRSVHSIDAYETGRRRPSLPALSSIAETLHVPVGTFFTDPSTADPVIAAIMATFPPLSPDQRDQLAVLLRADANE